MGQDIHQQILEIKKSLRLSMNGVVSAHYRKQGLDYKINFGVEIPRLKGIATNFDKSKELAGALWKENIRECKMLAIFLMPANEFTIEEAEEWIASARFTEIADNIVINLLSEQRDICDKALQWIESSEGLFPYCGYLLFAKMFREGKSLDETQQSRYIAQAIKSLSKEESKVLQGGAYNSLQRFIEIDEEKNIDKVRKAAKVAEAYKDSIIERLLQLYE